jgi:hypothetical protein
MEPTGSTNGRVNGERNWTCQHPSKIVAPDRERSGLRLLEFSIEYQRLPIWTARNRAPDRIFGARRTLLGSRLREARSHKDSKTQRKGGTLGSSVREWAEIRSAGGFGGVGLDWTSKRQGITCHRLPLESHSSHTGRFGFANMVRLRVVTGGCSFASLSLRVNEPKQIREACRASPHFAPQFWPTSAPVPVESLFPAGSLGMIFSSINRD